MNANLNHPMRLNLQHFCIASTDELDSWVERQILALGQLRRIDEANIRLARRVGVSPAFEARVHLVTPGPDVRAEGLDHTIEAAFAKAMAELREKIGHLDLKRSRRSRSQPGTPAARRHASRALATATA